MNNQTCYIYNVGLRRGRKEVIGIKDILLQ